MNVQLGKSSYILRFFYLKLKKKKTLNASPILNQNITKVLTKYYQNSVIHIIYIYIESALLQYDLENKITLNARR